MIANDDGSFDEATVDVGEVESFCDSGLNFETSHCGRHGVDSYFVDAEENDPGLSKTTGLVTGHPIRVLWPWVANCYLFFVHRAERSEGSLESFNRPKNK